MNDNLPRGVQLSDIPGNSPQDEAFAKRMEECFELLDTCKEMIEELVIDDFLEEFSYILCEWLEERKILLA